MASRVALFLIAALPAICQIPLPGILEELRTLNRTARSAKLTDRDANRRSTLLYQLIEQDPKLAIELAQLEATSDTNGILEATVEEDFTSRKSRTRWVLRTVDGKAVDLFFASGTPSNTGCGRSLTAKGIRVGTRIAVSEFAEAADSPDLPQLLSAQCAAFSSGTRNVAERMVRTPGTALPANVTSTALETAFFGSGTSLKNYWSEVSYGRVTASGSVFGPFTLDANYSCAQWDEIISASIRAADASVDLTQFHHLVVVGPFNGEACGWSGKASVGCQRLDSPSRGRLSAGVVTLTTNSLTSNNGIAGLAAHELGHNLGLGHANTMTFPGVPLADPATGTIDEYGDILSVMGASQGLGHYDASHKSQLGWLTAANVTTITALSGTYTIAPLEFPSAGPQALRIHYSNSADLWIEYRRNAGFDAFQAPFIPNLNGAWIRYQNPSLPFGTDDTYLLNFHPGASTARSLLLVGESWQDPATGLRLRVDNATDAGLTITVTDRPAIPPPPVLISVTTNPNPAIVSQTFTMTLNGTGFDPATAEILFNGVVLTPLPNKTSTQLQFRGAVAVADTYSMSVRNGSTGIPSNSLPLTVSDISPVISSIAPNPVESGLRTITIQGANFNASSQIEIGSTIITPTSFSATELRFTTVLTPGNFALQVRNRTAGTISNIVSLTVNPTGAISGSHFVPITPCRATDTRPNNIMARDSARSFTFTNCSIPSNATALALNVTLVPSGQFGYLSIWPAGQPQPVVSTMNSLDGRIKANAAIVGVGVGGAVSIYVTDAAHIILDVNGYFVPAGTAGALAFYPLDPCRVVDTRSPGGGGIVAANTTRRVAGGCLPATAQAYSLNITSVPPAPLGFLTLWPDGSGQPTVSTLNNLTGTVVANAAILRAGTGGAFNAYVTDASHIIADLNGYFAPPGSPGALAFYPSTPCRIFDTRNAAGAFGGPMLNADGTRAFTVPASACGIPASAKAYVTNATVLPIGVFGFLTIWPGGQVKPTVSTLNAVDGALTSNAAIVPASASGVIQVYTSNAANMLLDISGYFAP
jgi:M6 family metalloprotease-like protein